MVLIGRLNTKWKMNLPWQLGSYFENDLSVKQVPRKLCNSQFQISPALFANIVVRAPGQRYLGGGFPPETMQSFQQFLPTLPSHHQFT